MESEVKLSRPLKNSMRNRAIFSTSGAIFLLNSTDNLEKKQKFTREHSQIQSRKFPEIADFCPLARSNTAWLTEKLMFSCAFCAWETEAVECIWGDGNQWVDGLNIEDLFIFCKSQGCFHGSFEVRIKKLLLRQQIDMEGFASSPRTLLWEEDQKTFRYLWRFCSLLFRGPHLLGKQCFGLFRGFSWPSFWANFARTRPRKVFWEEIRHLAYLSHEGETHPKKSPIQIKAQFAQIISGQFVQTVPRNCPLY